MTIPLEESNHVVLTPGQFLAVLFDLDRVVTDTARVHFAAWTEVLDGFLRTRAQNDDVPFAPFTAADYRTYVDGRPHLEAIRTFLTARSVALPEGNPSDGPERSTVHGLGARKNEIFLNRIRSQGVDVYPSTVALIRRLRGLRFKVGLVTASRNCAEIVRAVGLASLFDAMVDGNDQAALSLRGKPAPDSFLEAARRLGTAPSRSVAVEDAIARVAAARALDSSLASTAATMARHFEPRVPMWSSPTCRRSNSARRGPSLLTYDDFDPTVDGQRQASRCWQMSLTLITKGGLANAA